MKKRFKKILVSCATAACIFTSSFSAYAQVYLPTSIYEYKTSENLSSGVVHDNIKRFTTAGWWNINVLNVDLKDEFTDIKGIYNPEGLHKRGTVTSLVEKSGAIAGINGDYFNYNPLPSPMGTLINNGEIISSPIERAYALPTLYLNNQNVPNIDYMDRSIIITNMSQNKHSIQVNTLNKVTPKFDTVTLLNRKWGDKSIGNRFHKDLIEIVVENGTVIDNRFGQEPVTIPENGYVLAVRYPNTQSLENYQVGDIIDLDIRTTPDLDSIKFAIGGGSVILRDGETLVSNIHSAGSNPRTGIGITKEGDKLLLVTIDGRDASYKGVGQEMFGAILRDLGAYNGINLDGGGSTTMAAKSIGDDQVRLINKPSDGGQRAVANGVGLFSNVPKGDLSYVKITTDDEMMFLGTSRLLDVKGFDAYHNPVQFDKSAITYSVNAEDGDIVGNRFIAKKEGNIKITAMHRGAPVGDTTINVLGELRDLVSNEDNINLNVNSERKLPSFTGKDKRGYLAKVYPEDLEFTVHGDIGSIDNGVFRSSGNTTAGAITASKGSAVENIVVSVGGNPILIENFQDTSKFKFSAYPTNVQGSIYSSINAKEGSNSLGLRYDMPTGDQNRAAYVNFPTGGLPMDGMPKRLGLWVKGDNSGLWLRGTVRDKNNQEHSIDFAKSIDWDDYRYVSAEIPSNVAYPIKLEKIYVVETDPSKSHVGEILIDGLTANYPPKVGTMVLPTPSKLTDDNNVKSEVAVDGFTFTAGFDPKGLNEFVGYDARSKVVNKFNENDMGIVMGTSSVEFNGLLNQQSTFYANNTYSRSKRGSVTFLNINTSKRGIRTSNVDQWGTLKQDLDSISTKNLVITLSSPVFGKNGFTDKMEADVFHSLLENLQKSGKEVFVVFEDNTTDMELIDGIRYIGVNGSTISNADQIYNISMVDFVANGDNLTYVISHPFERPSAKVSN